MITEVEPTNKILNVRIIIPYKSVGLESDAIIYSKTIKKINKYTEVHISKSSDLSKLLSDSKLSNSQFFDDIHIYISNADKVWFPYSEKKYFMVNHELFYQSEADAEILSQIDTALCRTDIGSKWAEKIKTEHNFNYRIATTRFTTYFQEKQIIKHWNIILHSAGEHHWKQTDAIIKTWQKYQDLPVIIITCTGQCYRNVESILKSGGHPTNIILHKKLLEHEDFVLLKNKIGIHLCPSIVEGYGHYINEARKIKSLVITTNAPPMNELIDETSGILINCSSYGTKKNGTSLCFVSVEDIHEAVIKAQQMSIEEKKQMANNAYDKFIADTKTFETSIIEMLA